MKSVSLSLSQKSLLLNKSFPFDEFDGLTASKLRVGPFNWFRAGKLALFVFCAGFLFLGLVGQAWGATYYVDNSCSNNGDGTANNCAASSGDVGAFSSMVNMVAKSGGYQPGDVIDGNDLVYYEQFIFPSSGASENPITLKNFTLDGSVSIDGNWSFNPTNTYSNISSWSNPSGNVWQKTSTRGPSMLWEDGIYLDPSPFADDASAIAGLTAGHWAYIFSTSHIFYRASDDAAPSTHNIRANNRAWDSTGGYLLKLVDLSYVNIDNITLQKQKNNVLGQGALSVVGSSNHINITGVHLAYNAVGGAIGNSYIAFSGIVDHNSSLGLSLQPSSSNIDITGTFEYNGRILSYYTSNSVTYEADGDGIGIGGNGGDFSNITIHDATIQYNGPPNGNAQIIGSGIYIGTSYAMTMTGLEIARNLIKGNHLYGLMVDSDLDKGANIHNNLFINNVNDSGHTYHALLIGSSVAGAGNMYVDNNDFIENSGKSAVYISGNEGNVYLRNNIFYNNGYASSRADLWIGTGFAGANVTESNNLFYRSGTSWDSRPIIEKNVVTWDRNHIVGSSGGYWQNDSGKGVGDVGGVTDPLFVSPANFNLQNTSPAINAGVGVGLTSDYEGSSVPECRNSSPDIGAYEYQRTCPDGPGFFPLPNPPLPVTDVAVSFSNNQITLSWTNPNALTNTLVYHQRGSPIIYRDYQNQIYSGLATSTIDLNLTNNTTYYYSIYTTDSYGQISSAVNVSAIPQENSLSNTALTSGGIAAITTTPIVSTPSLPASGSGQATTTTSSTETISNMETIQAKITSVVSEVANLPKNPSPSDLNAIQQKLLNIISELQSIQSSQVSSSKATFATGLYYGLQSEDVKNLQSLLKQDPSIYPEGVTNGRFGPATLRAIKRFQLKYNLAQEGDPGYGYVGPRTRERLNGMGGGR